MSVLVELGADVEWPDLDAMANFRAHDPRRLGELGELGVLAEWLAGAQALSPPRELHRVRLVRFGRRPGQEAFDVPTAFPAGTRDVDSFLPGGSDRLATVTRVIQAGATIADDEIDGGADLLVAALAGHEIAAAVLVAVLTNTEPVKVMPRGAVTPPSDWMADTVKVRDGRRHAFAHRESPLDLLATVEALDVAAVTGFLLRCAARRTPVLLDGLPVAAAALVAHDTQARAARWWRAADLSDRPAHELALTRLGHRAVLELGTALDDGTAGALAAGLLEVAVRVAPPGNATGVD